MASRKRSMSNDSDVSHLYKELDEALCPICMDHPHNAVLLVCSSHDKSCRSYICDTSYRHSNCLDRFKKLKEEENTDDLSSTSLAPETNQDSVLSSSLDFTVMTDHAVNSQTQSSSMVHPQADSGSVEREGRIWGSLDIREATATMEKSEEASNLRCPLCRGRVLGWKVVEEARKYLNLKTRSCSHESCSFSGSYREIRRHARRVHPTVRPADVDPSRQRAWHRLEHQREHNDIVSAIRSAMPGAVIFGDYVIDGGGDRDRDRNGSGGEGGSLLSTLFFFQMIGQLEPRAELRGGRSRLLPRHRRNGGASSRRRYLWGENLLGHHEDEDDDDEGDEDREPEINILTDLGEDAPPNPRRRRRMTRAESDEDQQ